MSNLLSKHYDLYYFEEKRMLQQKLKKIICFLLLHLRSSSYYHWSPVLLMLTWSINLVESMTISQITCKYVKSEAHSILIKQQIRRK